LRVAALAFGVLAGLVASLILALGGLDVGANLTDGGERQVQAIRFGLLLIANLGIFGAALVLAAPLASAIVLVMGALAWVGAALLTQHTTDYVLITPPALLLVAAVLATIAHFRRPRPEIEDEPEIEIIAPEPQRTRQRPSDMMGDDDEEMGIPAFAAEAPRAPSRGYDDDERPPPRNDDWNPRRRPPPPPRTKPAFRPIEEEYDEPGGFSRFALGLSSVLSFGLYAALAGAAVLVIWNLRDTTTQPPSAVVAEAPVVSETSIRAPTLSSQPSSEPFPTLAPTLTAEAETSRELRLPSLPPVSSEPTPPPTAVAAPAPEGFGEVTIGGDGIPTLSDSFDSGNEAAGGASSLEPIPPPSAASSEPQAPSAEPQPPAPEPVVAAADPAPIASVPAAGQPFPRLTSAQIAALRQTASPGITRVATPSPRANTTGL
jgi:hypothetical protein